MNKEIYLTKEGFTKLQEEYKYLTTTKRFEILEALKEARALGDLSENAEYDAAKNDQGACEGRIKELEVILEKAVIIENASKDVASLGSVVTIDYGDLELETYTIVGSQESDTVNNKISNESPIAKAIIGHKVNDIVKVQSPGGEYEIKITKIA